MTRDFELIRQILFQVDRAPSGQPLQTLSFEDDNIDEAVIGEHLEIMIEVGLIEGEVLTTNHSKMTATANPEAE